MSQFYQMNPLEPLPGFKYAYTVLSKLISYTYQLQFDQKWKVQKLFNNQPRMIYYNIIAQWIEDTRGYHYVSDLSPSVRL